MRDIVLACTGIQDAYLVDIATTVAFAITTTLFMWAVTKLISRLFGGKD